MCPCWILTGFRSERGAMVFNETEVKKKDVEHYATSLARISRVVFILFRVVAIMVAGIVVIPLLVAMIGYFFGLDVSVQVDGSIGNAVLLALELLLFAIAIWALSSICKNVFCGSTPFSLSQVRRIRFVALCIFLLAFVDFFVSQGSVSFVYSGMEMGLFSYFEDSSRLNIAALISSAALFLLSFVFKYGVLLQSVSDDTV